MNSTKLLLIGAAMVLGSGTAIVQAQTQSATPAKPPAQATPADASADAPAIPAAKAIPAQPASPAALPTDAGSADKSANAADPKTPPVKRVSKKKLH